jgi:hypothetical protein
MDNKEAVDGFFYVERLSRQRDEFTCSSVAVGTATLPLSAHMSHNAITHLPDLAAGAAHSSTVYTCCDVVTAAVGLEAISFLSLLRPAGSTGKGQWFFTLCSFSRITPEN